MGRVRKNLWGWLSILITVGSALSITTIIEYLYREGLWTDKTSIKAILSWWADLALLLSIITAAVGLFKDESRKYSVVALILSFCSILLYVQ